MQNETNTTQEKMADSSLGAAYEETFGKQWSNKDQEQQLELIQSIRELTEAYNKQYTRGFLVACAIISALVAGVLTFLLVRFA